MTPPEAAATPTAFFSECWLDESEPGGLMRAPPAAAVTAAVPNIFSIIIWYWATLNCCCCGLTLGAMAAAAAAAGKDAPARALFEGGDPSIFFVLEVGRTQQVDKTGW